MVEYPEEEATPEVAANTINTTNDEVEEMTNLKPQIYTDENIDRALNSKEEFEVLRGLTIGNDTYEKSRAVHYTALASLYEKLM